MYRYPNYDHLIAGLNSAIAQADQMDLATAQTVDTITRALQRENDNLDQIDRVQQQIEETGRVSILDMNKVESIVSGTIDRAGGATRFSFNPTTNNLEGAVEAINWAKVGKIGIIGAIVAAILAIIYKIFKFMKSGKVDEIAKDIIEDQKKTEKSFTKAIVIPAIKRSGEMTIGDSKGSDTINFDTMSAEEIMDKVRETNEKKKSKPEVKKSPEELRKEKRYGNKLDISIPKTTGVVNEKLGTNFKEADLQKGFQSLLNSMQSAFIDGKVVGGKDEISDMTVEAKLFLLEKVPKFKERRPQFAIMLAYLMPREIVGKKIAHQITVTERLRQFEESHNAFVRLVELCGQYKEIFSAKADEKDAGKDWEKRNDLLTGLQLGNKYTIGDSTEGDRSKTVEDTIAVLERDNYNTLPQALENIANYAVDIDEDSFLADLGRNIDKLKKFAEGFEDPVKKLEENVAEANTWFDNIITGKQTRNFIDSSIEEDTPLYETHFLFLRTLAKNIKGFLNKVLDHARKTLAQIMAYMKESQMVLSYCMNGKGFHHELSETAGFIAMSMSKEIANRVDND